MLDKTFLDLYIAVLHMEPGANMKVSFEMYRTARKTRKKLRGHLVDISREHEYTIATRKQGHELYIKREVVP